MKLTWLGHACFLLEEDGYRIVLDPYTGVAGYPPLHIQAHAVFCSHGHFDHHATDCVELLPERESPFTVREVETFHDDRGGALRGTNTVRIFTAGGLSVAHLGDLGHQLTGGAGSGHRPGGRRAGASRGRLHSGCRRSKGGVRCAASSLRGAHALPPRALRPDGGGQRGAVFGAVVLGGGPPPARSGV